MIDNLHELLTNAKTVGISGHIRPDGDCVGSCLAMYNYIVTYYPYVEAHVYLDPIPNTFKFLKNADKIQDIHTVSEDTVFDLYIALDCSEGSRLGDAFNFFEKAKHTVCIDHHFSNNGFSEFSYIIPDDSSTCELVYNQIGKEKITKDIAECLYLGIIHDTGVFQYSCTTEATMAAAGFLMTKGIDYPKICTDTYFAKTMVQNRMLGKALLGCKTYLDGKVIAAVITAEDMAEFGAESKHLEGIVQQLRDTTGVEVAVFLYELADGDFKGSTRATGDVDLTVITGVYGGGGHKKAAGFSVDTDKPWDVIDNIVSMVEKQLKELGLY
ncbi:DHH family phosphoesterase [Pseudobutyrivibrio ruminis]|uniref:Phosphoesterase RecJ domain-containing protein n=1 Tax=Pseudobutyrivibrio ruminis DSM 9787 TaxID=1123011 RepID=A0A285RGZ9_9FIRM|nr:DHH family phosphoesterase [Pseudobutyrivibrio ruminis]SOB91682.1 phosphoesterase RecJ domain-containing protein [Pseudobutyrivibrio ruminis DSM 9787]